MSKTPTESKVLLDALGKIAEETPGIKYVIKIIKLFLNPHSTTIELHRINQAVERLQIRIRKNYTKVSQHTEQINELIELALRDISTEPNNDKRKFLVNIIHGAVAADLPPEDGDLFCRIIRQLPNDALHVFGEFWHTYHKSKRFNLKDATHLCNKYGYDKLLTLCRWLDSLGLIHLHDAQPNTSANRMHKAMVLWSETGTDFIRWAIDKQTDE